MNNSAHASNLAAVTQEAATSFPTGTVLIFLGGKKRPARRADNLTAICEPIV
jgi:hypothetical protein